MLGIGNIPFRGGALLLLDLRTGYTVCCEKGDEFLFRERETERAKRDA